MINELAVFIDKHHRAIRAGLYVIGFTGLVVFIRSTRVLKVYRNVTDIPAIAIQQQHLLRGVVKNVSEDGSMAVAHQPLIFRNIIKARDREYINIRLAAVQPADGFVAHLNKSVHGKHVRFSLLNQNTDVADAILYQRVGWFSQRICVNEDVIRNGLGVVQTSPELVHSDVCNRLARVLLKVEVKADKRGKKGVWKRPSKMEAWKNWLRSWYR